MVTPNLKQFYIAVGAPDAQKASRIVLALLACSTVRPLRMAVLCSALRVTSPFLEAITLRAAWKVSFLVMISIGSDGVSDGRIQFCQFGFNLSKIHLV
jgi:hypothetical protein